MLTFEIPANEHVPREAPVCEKSFNQLLMEADQIASEIGVPEDMREATWELLGQLKDFDEATAKDSLQTLPLALRVADVIKNFYGNPKVNRPNIWCAAILHDFGKIYVGEEVVFVSNEGRVWNEEYHEKMRAHVIHGSNAVLAAGLPYSVGYAIREHHAKQFGGRSYGVDPELDEETRITRDCLAIADFTDACITRNNTRNTGKSLDDRFYEINQDANQLFDDYSEGESLAWAIFADLHKYYEQDLMNVAA